MIRLSPLTVLCAVSLVFAWGWYRLDQAGSRIRSAQARFVTLDQDLQRLEELRTRIQSPIGGRRPQDDLVTRAQQALAAAGLPIGACSGVQPRADQTANGLRIQTVQLRLQGLRPAEFAAWLAAWRASDQPWHLSELQMVHTTAAPSAGANRFDLMLILTAPYLEDRL